MGVKFSLGSLRFCKQHAMPTCRLRLVWREVLRTNQFFLCSTRLAMQVSPPPPCNTTGCCTPYGNDHCHGDMTGCYGDMTGCYGDMTGCYGDTTGCYSNMTGCCSDMTGCYGFGCSDCPHASSRGGDYTELCGEPGAGQATVSLLLRLQGGSAQQPGTVS